MQSQVSASGLNHPLQLATNKFNPHSPLNTNRLNLHTTGVNGEGQCERS